MCNGHHHHHHIIIALCTIPIITIIGTAHCILGTSLLSLFYNAVQSSSLHSGSSSPSSSPSPSSSSSSLGHGRPSAGNGLAGSSGGDQFERKKLLMFSLAPSALRSVGIDHREVIFFCRCWFRISHFVGCEFCSNPLHLPKQYSYLLK